MEQLENLRILVAMESEDDNVKEFEAFLLNIFELLPSELQETLKDRFDIEQNNAQNKQIQELSQNIKAFDLQNAIKVKGDISNIEQDNLANNQFINRNQKRLQLCQPFNNQGKRFKHESQKFIVDKQVNQEAQISQMLQISSSLPVEVTAESENKNIANSHQKSKNNLMFTAQQSNFKEKDKNLVNKSNSSAQINYKQIFQNEESLSKKVQMNKQAEKNNILSIEKQNSTKEKVDKFKNNDDIFSASTLFSFK